MQNNAKMQVSTNKFLDYSQINKCIDVLTLLYNSKEANAQTDLQRAYICQANENTIIVKERKKQGKEIATFPKNETFEYVASKQGDKPSKEANSISTNSESTKVQSVNLESTKIVSNTNLESTKVQSTNSETTKVQSTNLELKKNENKHQQTDYSIYSKHLNQYQNTHENLTRNNVSSFAIDLHKAGFCVISNILPPAYEKIETQTESEIKEIFSKPNAKELHLLLTKNLFCIDLDLKVFESQEQKNEFWQNFQSKLVTIFGNDIFNKLVIESTKNKGFHLYFYAPDLESKAKAKKNLAYYQNKPLIEFLSKKVTCFPTQNYEFIQGSLQDIPILNDLEFANLINVCQSFCTKPKEIILPKDKTQFENNFNNSFDDKTIFDFCVSIIDKKHSFAPGNTNDYLTNLIHYCNIKGISKEYVLSECQSRFITNKVKRKDITSKVNSIYNNHKHEHNSEPYNEIKPKFERKEKSNQLQSKTKNVQNNEQKQAKEKNLACIRIEKTTNYINKLGLAIDKHTKKYYLGNNQIDRMKINSILLDCKKMFNVSKEDFFVIIESEYITKIDKIENLKKECENTYNCKGAIKELFNTLILEMPEYKELYYSIFEKWFIGIWQSLAGKGQRAKNDLFLVFCGDNNLGKSFFIKELFESVNLDCAVLDKNNENNENDLKRFSTANACIIFDDLKKDLFKKDDFFKNILSNANIDIVPKYDNTPETKKRIASFCGTSNYKNIIFQSEFNRRIVPISIIDRNKEDFDKIDKIKVFAEAYHLFVNGETHELNKNEIDFVKNVLSIEHKEVSFENDFVFEYIKPANETEPNAIFLKASEINEALPETLRKNVTQLGILLNNLGFKRLTNKSINGKRFASCYCVILVKND